MGSSYIPGQQLSLLETSDSLTLLNDDTFLVEKTPKKSRAGFKAGRSKKNYHKYLCLVEKCSKRQRFISCVGNHRAYEIGQIIAQKPGREFPVFTLIGPNGVGKTHLIQNLCQDLIQNISKIRISYFFGKELENIFHLMDSTNEVFDFFSFLYRECDVLVVDGMEEIFKNGALIEEINILSKRFLRAEKQIIFIGDEPKKCNRPLYKHLRSHLYLGLVERLANYSNEDMQIILQEKESEFGVALSSQERQSLVRENKVEDLDEKFYVLKSNKLIGESTHSMYLPQVQYPKEMVKIIAQEFRVQEHDLFSNGRGKLVSFARHVTMYFFKQLAELNLSEIGEIFNRDHSSVSYALKKIESQLKSDQFCFEQIEGLRKKLVH